MSTFGTALAALRIRAGLSQMKLADRAGMDASSINRLEDGTRNPSRATVMDISQALELDIDETDRLREAAGFSSRSTPEVDRFRRLPPDLQRALLDFAEKARAVA